MSCSCGGKVVGMPGQTRKCNFCGAKVRVTKKVVAKNNAGRVNKKVAIKVVTKGKKTPAKPVKKVAKKRPNNAQPSAMA
jgi:hypothetical protein